MRKFILVIICLLYSTWSCASSIQSADEEEEDDDENEEEVIYYDVCANNIGEEYWKNFLKANEKNIIVFENSSFIFSPTKSLSNSKKLDEGTMPASLFVPKLTDLTMEEMEDKFSKKEHSDKSSPQVLETEVNIYLSKLILSPTPGFPDLFNKEEEKMKNPIENSYSNTNIFLNISISPAVTLGISDTSTQGISLNQYIQEKIDQSITFKTAVLIDGNTKTSSISSALDQRFRVDNNWSLNISSLSETISPTPSLSYLTTNSYTKEFFLQSQSFSTLVSMTSTTPSTTNRMQLFFKKRTFESLLNENVIPYTLNITSSETKSSINLIATSELQQMKNEKISSDANMQTFDSTVVEEILSNEETPSNASDSFQPTVLPAFIEATVRPTISLKASSVFYSKGLRNLPANQNFDLLEERNHSTDLPAASMLTEQMSLATTLMKSLENQSNQSDIFITTPSFDIIDASVISEINENIGRSNTDKVSSSSEIIDSAVFMTARLATPFPNPTSLNLDNNTEDLRQPIATTIVFKSIWNNGASADLSSSLKSSLNTSKSATPLSVRLAVESSTTAANNFFMPDAQALGTLQEPSFIKHPRVFKKTNGLDLSINYEVGSLVTISPCVFKTVFANDSLQTHWLKDGIVKFKAGIRQLEKNTYEFINDDFLKKPLEVDDQGFYQCSVFIPGLTSNAILSEKFDIQLQETTNFKVILEELSNADVLNQFLNAQLRSKRDLSLALNNIDDAAVKAYFRHKIEGIMKVVFQIEANATILEISKAIVSRVTFINAKEPNKLNSCNLLQNLISPQILGELNVQALNVQSLDCCLQDTYGESSYKGVYSFEKTLHSTLVKKNCSYYNTGYATRYCIADFKDGPRWEKPNLQNCSAKSKETQQLIQFSEFPICNVKSYVPECLPAIQLVSNVSNLVSSISFEVTTHYDIDLLASILNNVVTSLDYLHNEVTFETAEKVLRIISIIMNFNASMITEAQIKSASSTMILSLMDEQARNLSSLVQEFGPISIKNDNVALYVDVVDKGGFGLYAKQNVDNDLEVFLNKQNIPFDDAIASIYIPQETFLHRKEIVYAYIFRKDVLFKNDAILNSSEPMSYLVQSPILSVTLGDGKVSDLLVPIELKFKKVYESNKAGSDSCTFWDFDQDIWSTNGCVKVLSENKVVTCSCNHLTNFALLLDINQDSYNPISLQYVTWIGCGISFVSLVITLVTFSMFRNLRKKLAPKILMFLCVSLIGLLVTFLAGAQATSSRINCQIAAAFIQFFTLTTFCWMGVEAVNLYRSLVIVFKKGGNTSFLKKSCVFAVGVPLVVVIITAAVKPANLGNEKVCLVQGFSFTFGILVPVVLILAFNFFVLGLVLRALAMKKKSSEKKEYYIKQMKLTFICAVLLGLTWVFGILAIKSLAKPMQWLFCITTSLQGFFIFVSYVVQNKEAAKEWSRFFGVAKVSINSSTSNSQYRLEKPTKKKQSCVSVTFENLS